MSAKPAGPRLLGPNSSAAERSGTDCAERRQLGDMRWAPKIPAAATKTTTQTSVQMRVIDARDFAGAVSWSMHPRYFDGGAGVLVVDNATAHGANSGADCRPQRGRPCADGRTRGRQRGSGRCRSAHDPRRSYDTRPTQQEPPVAGSALSG